MATPGPQTSVRAGSGRRKRLQAGVPRSGGIGMDAGLLDLLANSREQAAGVPERSLELVSAPLAQAPQEPELTLGDPEVDLVADRRHPLEEAGAEGLPQRDRVAFAGDRRQEAVVEVDA